jgi:group I intron endonuclease
MRRIEDTRPTFIYVLKESVDGEVRYVGKTIQKPQKRLKNHLSDKEINHRTNWINSLLLQGLEPIMEIIETVPYDQDWVEREKYWIKYYRDAGCNLVNATDGGDGTPGYVPTMETRRKMSLINTGKTLSQETKNKMSLSRMGRKASKKFIQSLFDRAKEVCQYDKDGNFVSKHRSCRTASELTGINATKIRACANMKRLSAGGFQWRYFDGQNDTAIEKINCNKPVNRKNVFQYTLSWDFVNSFDSVMEAGRQTGISFKKISACALGKKKSCGGYRWSYSDLMK